MIAEIIGGLDRMDSPVSLAVAEPYMGDRILSPLYPGEEHAPDWDIERAYDEALKKCAMVDRCVMGLAEKAASLPLRVWERDEGSKGTVASDHPLEDVLNNPRRDPVMGSREELVTRTIAHHRLAGTALTGIRRAADILQGGRQTPAELVAEDPREVYPVPSKQLKIAQWNYRDGDGRTRAWLREDLVAWRRHDPRNSVWGRSVLQSLALNVDASVQNTTTRLLRATRDGRPGMVLSDKGITSPEDGREKEQLLNARQRRNRGGILLLGGEQQLVAAGMPEKDLGILTSEAFDRDMIAIAFGYLPAGFSNDASTYANSGIFVLHEWSLVQQAMASWCSQLGAFLFTREERRRLYIAPDYSEVQALADANLEKLSKLAALAFKGVAINDLISGLGLPLPLQPGGDVALVPRGMVPLAQAVIGEVA